MFDYLLGLNGPRSGYSYAIGDILGAGLIMGGSTLLGSILGSRSNNSANKMNYQLGKETNELNYKMHQEDIQQQWDMWNAQNEYNTPVNQAKRLQAAGINPQLAMQDGNLGMAGSMSVPAGAPAQRPADMKPYDWSSALNQFGSQIASAVQMNLESKMQAAEIRNKNASSALMEVDAQTRHQINMANLRKTMMDSSVSKWQRNLAKLQYNFEKRTEEMRFLQLQNQNKLLASQDEVNVAQADLTRWQKLSGELHDKLDIKADKRASRQLNALLEQIHEQVEEINARTDLTQHQVATEVHRAISIQLENKGKVFDNAQKAVIYQYLEPKILSEINKNNRESGSFSVGIGMHGINVSVPTVGHYDEHNNKK